MHILILTKKFPYPLKDGESIAIMNLARNYALAGNQVTMLSMTTPKHNQSVDEAEPELQGYIRFETVWVDTSIRIIQIPVNYFEFIPYHIKRFISPAYRQKLKSILLETKFDIIQLEGLFLAPYIKIAKQYSEAKIVLRSHNIEGMIWQRYAKRETNILKKIFLQQQASKLLTYEIRSTKLYDAIVPISTADHTFFKAHFPHDRIKYIPSGVDADNRFTETTIDFNTIYYLGALDWLPNKEGLQWFLRNVFPQVLQKNPAVRFHIAGRNPGKWTKTLKHENIVFHGEIENAAHFIADKFICIVPLLSGSGMKLKILEALSLGKHVVTTPLGAEGLPDEVQAYISIAEKEADFAEKILSALKNIVRTREKANTAARFVTHHLNNKILADAVLKFYKTIS
ncbi:MAG: glycosyltransferase [Chitinophagales bacterium]|nr:glycosyltransferase [Chitinophagales bacterium]